MQPLYIWSKTQIGFFLLFPRFFFCSLLSWWPSPQHFLRVSNLLRKKFCFYEATRLLESSHSGPEQTEHFLGRSNNTKTTQKDKYGQIQIHKHKGKYSLHDVIYAWIENVKNLICLIRSEFWNGPFCGFSTKKMGLRKALVTSKRIELDGPH